LKGLAQGNKRKEKLRPINNGRLVKQNIAQELFPERERVEFILLRYNSIYRVV